MASSYITDIDDVEMSSKGMQLLLNNDLDACHDLFDRYRFYSPLMNGGWSFVSFMVKRILSRKFSNRKRSICFSSELLFLLMINV
jgi:hypothetical protein